MHAPDDTTFDDIAVLAEPLRRQLYRHVASQAEPVSRDAAAAAVGTNRSLAAFHLDRLVEAGLLEATYRRLSGKAGPGAGRPSKLYARSAREIAVTLPARRYELAGRLFADAIARGTVSDGSALDALDAAASSFGETLGGEARRRAGPRAGRTALLEQAVDVLREYGFEPARGGNDEVVLRNCPFDALARTHRDVVCGMNQSLMDGVIAGLKTTGIRAVLDPQPGMCCVVWRRDP